MEKIKECPFCGGSADMEQTGETQLTIKCCRCFAKMVQKWFHKSQGWLEGKMIERWNRRE